MRVIGDAGKDAHGGEHDPDAVVPVAIVIGKSPSTMSISARLLSSSWSATMLCKEEAEAEAALEGVLRYAAESRGEAVDEKDIAAAAGSWLRRTVKKLASLPKDIVEKTATAAANKRAIEMG